MLDQVGRGRRGRVRWRRATSRDDSCPMRCSTTRAQRVYAARVDGRMVGPPGRAPRWTAWSAVFGVATLPDVRRRGIGAALTRVPARRPRGRGRPRVCSTPRELGLRASTSGSGFASHVDLGGLGPRGPRRPRRRRRRSRDRRAARPAYDRDLLLHRDRRCTRRRRRIGSDPSNSVTVTRVCAVRHVDVVEDVAGLDPAPEDDRERCGRRRRRSPCRTRSAGHRPSPASARRSAGSPVPGRPGLARVPDARVVAVGDVDRARCRWPRRPRRRACGRAHDGGSRRGMSGAGQRSRRPRRPRRPRGRRAPRTSAIAARWDVRTVRILPFGPVGSGQYWWDACVPGRFPFRSRFAEAGPMGKGRQLP